MDFNIFVSYSTKDLEHLELLKAQLINTPIKLFIAENSVVPGDSVSEKIKKAINSCDLFVVIWSKNARQSDWVPQEIGQAIAHNKPILPLVLGQENPPAAFTSDIKYIRIYQDLPTAMMEAQRIMLDAYQKKAESIQRQQAQRQKQKESEQMTKLGIGAILLWLTTRK